MKHIKIFSTLFFILFFTSISYAQGLEGCEEHVKYGVPSQSPILLCRLGYALSHDSKNKVADWVSYHLTKQKAQGIIPRSEGFHADPDLESGERSENSDYSKSGYDKGHMAPAADMKWDERAMNESFLLSNIAPQVGQGFNRGIWNILEKDVRNWTIQRTELYIITGPIYDSNNIKTIGKNKVAVPTHFYKVIFDPIRIEAIAFILPNAKLETKDLPTFITSVDKVEELTGLNFLSEIEDGVEDLIEKKVQEKMW